MTHLQRVFAFATLVVTTLATVAITAAEPSKPPVLTTLKSGQVAALFDGKSLDGWKTIEEFSFEKHGAVTVEKGEIRLGKGRPATGIAWKGDLPRSDYELTLEAKRVEGEDFFCGLTFPVGKEYCTLILGGWGGSVTGLSNIDGMSAVENETTGHEDFKLDKWYVVRLKVTADKIEAWVDKSQVVDLKTADRTFAVWWEQEPARPLGVATWETGAVRSVKFKRLGGK